MNQAVIFDFLFTLYDPGKNRLYSGVPRLLARLKKRGWLLFLVSIGGRRRRAQVEKLGLAPFFTEMRFVFFKNAFLFADLAARHDLDPKRTYVVGDGLYSEIAAGRQAGLKTIWVGPENGRGEPADAVVRQVTAVEKLLAGAD